MIDIPINFCLHLLPSHCQESNDANDDQTKAKYEENEAICPPKVDSLTFPAESWAVRKIAAIRLNNAEFRCVQFVESLEKVAVMTELFLQSLLADHCGIAMICFVRGNEFAHLVCEIKDTSGCRLARLASIADSVEIWMAPGLAAHAGSVIWAFDARRIMDVLAAERNSGTACHKETDTNGNTDTGKK
jgi:hypothetical protein